MFYSGKQVLFMSLHSTDTDKEEMRLPELVDGCV